jgi:hypothetical protein
LLPASFAGGPAPPPCHNSFADLLDLNGFANIQILVAQCAREVWQLKFDLSAFPAMERLRCLGEHGSRSRKDDGQSGHYNVDGTTVLMLSPGIVEAVVGGRCPSVALHAAMRGT